MTINADGVIQKTNVKNYGSAPAVSKEYLITMNIAKLSAIGTRKKNSNKITYGSWTIIPYEELDVDNNDIKYNDGKFTVMKDGYYFVNVYNYLLTPNDETGYSDGTAQTIIYNGETKIGGISTWHRSGTGSVDHNALATTYLNRGNEVYIKTSYTRDHYISNGNVTLIYLGPKNTENPPLQD